VEWSLGDQERVDKALADVADRVLEKKLTSAVCSLVNAASRANAWTLTGPAISNFEMFMQQLIESGDADVFRLVVGHVQDKAYMEFEASKHLMRQLFDLSRVMSVETVDQFPIITLQGDLWNPRRNRTHPEFTERGFEYWSFDTWEKAAAERHPITQWPWPHGDLFVLFYREEHVIGSAVSDVDWQYTTKAWLDREAIPFIPEAMAPLGYVFIGGKEVPMKKTMIQGMKLSKPIVVLNNTPSAAKQVSLLLGVLEQAFESGACAACRPFLAEGARLGVRPTTQDLLQALAPQKVLEHVEGQYDGSGLPPEERLTLADVEAVLDFAQRRPQAFRESVAVLDPLQECCSSTVSRLLTVFTSHHCPSKDGGTAAGHRSLLLRAWHLQLKLARRSAHLRRLATAAALATATAILLGTSLAVYAVLRLQRGAGAGPFGAGGGPPAVCLVDVALLVLPLSAGALLTLQNRYRPAQKWASVHLVASELASDIYKFLGSVGPYTSDPVSNQRKFSGRIRTMEAHVLSSGLVEEELQPESDDARDEAFAADPGALQQQIDQQLYGIQPPLCSCGGWGRSAARRGATRDWPWTSLLNDGQEPRDPTAPVTASVYVETRVTPLRKYYGSWVQWHSCLRMALNVAFALSLGAASVLGAAGFSMWVPLAMSVAAFVAAATQWLLPPEVFAAVNKALAALNDLDLRWQVSEIREQRSDVTKRRMITVTEKNSLAVAMTLSRTALLLIEDGDGWDGVRGNHAKDNGKECDPGAISVIVAPGQTAPGSVAPLEQFS